MAFNLGGCRMKQPFFHHQPTPAICAHQCLCLNITRNTLPINSSVSRISLHGRINQGGPSSSKSQGSGQSQPEGGQATASDEPIRARVGNIHVYMHLNIHLCVYIYVYIHISLELVLKDKLETRNKINSFF